MGMMMRALAMRMTMRLARSSRRGRRAARIGSAIAALHLQGDVRDVEAVVQQFAQRLTQAVAVDRFANHHVGRQGRGAGGQGPDVQIMHVVHVRVPGQGLAYLGEIHAFRHAFQQHISLPARQLAYWGPTTYELIMNIVDFETVHI